MTPAARSLSKYKAELPTSWISTFLFKKEWFSFHLYKNFASPIAEAAKVFGYKSRSTLYKLKSDGWLDDYIIHYSGRDHLQLKPKGKPSLATNIMGVIQWSPSNPIRNQKEVQEGAKTEPRRLHPLLIK